MENHFAVSSKKWWSNRRKKYNVGLVMAGVVAFICYAIVGATLIMPYDKQFEITLFTTVFQGIGYLFMLLIANLFYNLGYWVDQMFNSSNSHTFRQRLFNIGFWFSCGLPFLIPTLLVMRYFIVYHR